MRIAFVWPWLIGLVLSNQAQAQTQHYLTNQDCAFPIQKRYFTLVADDQPLQNADLAPAAINSAQTSPPARAAHLIELAESQRAYDEGRLADAAAALQGFLAEEPANPNVLYHYARALYRDPATRENSLPIYERLIQLLASYGREDRVTTVVYTLFAEAYYKLGTLQMDEGQWEQAAYSISRALLALRAVPSLKTPGAHEEALQYQTECFSHLGDAKLCRYYGELTLKLFPHNRYVRPYLAQLPANKPARKSPPRRP